jgi:K+-sensing histidine kinase KdpD
MDKSKKSIVAKAYENIQKAAEQSRLKQIESLEQMSFMISHKLRSPVCSMMGIMPILNDAAASISEKHSYINLICQSATKIDLFTKELSKFVESIRISLIADQLKLSKMKPIPIYV